jgi:2-phospho-L-lactate guanylyltransferase
VTTAIVPAKSFARAKSRLADVLDAPSRAALARTLFDHVLDVVVDSVRVSRVLVVTDGDDVEAVARARGLPCVRDTGTPPLRVAVDLGLEVVRERGAEGVLVLMTDLPWLSSADVTALVDGLVRAEVVLGPDSRHLGTNALGLGPGVCLPTAFGRADSFQEHSERARSLGLRVYVRESPGIGFDVDTPSDLRAMNMLSERRRARTGSAGRV